VQVQSPHPQAGLIGFDFYRHVVGQPVRAGAQWRKGHERLLQKKTAPRFHRNRLNIGNYGNVGNYGNLGNFGNIGVVGG
jgi:hypothetical protein